MVKLAIWIGESLSCYVEKIALKGTAWGQNKQTTLWNAKKLAT